MNDAAAPSSARMMKWYALGVLIASLLAGLIGLMILSRSTRASGQGDDAAFVRAVDLTPLDRAAVLSSGRVKSYDSFASEMLGLVAGRNRVRNQPADFTYLDMMFRPERYRDEPIIYVKNPVIRSQIAAALSESAALGDERAALLKKKGLLSPADLARPEVEALLQRLSMDVVRGGKHIDAIRSAIALSSPQVLRQQLRLLPPASNRPDERWLGVDQIWSPDLTLRAAEDEPLPGVAPELASELRTKWAELVTAWREQRDPAKVNRALADFAAILPRVAPDVYPAPVRMLLESWYFKAHHMTWVWIIYLFSMALLLMAVVYRWGRAHWLGLGFFSVAFALHTGALAWRWYASGRWPNSNMFEAVTTSVWLGTLVIIAVEIWARRTPMRNLFLLGGSGASMAAMMAAHYVPQLNASINNMMPVLHDLWLYIHTNVIIASYALIAMAAVTALLYLAYRALGGEPTYARVGGAAALLEQAADPTTDPIALDDTRTRAALSDSTLRAPQRRRSAGEVFDGATMVLMELSFIMLWAGIVMGAIWADHSWGRPWGWDPKEVFALNTFIVFLVLVHVRLKVRDKGLWTAVLAVIGCAVMLFNWIVINFVIAGLHSYA